MTKNAYPAKIAQALRDKRSGAGIHSGRAEIAHRRLQRANCKIVKSLAGRGFALCGRSGISLAKEGDMLTCLQKITETNFKPEEVKSRHYKASRPCVIIKNSQEDRI